MQMIRKQLTPLAVAITMGLTMAPTTAMAQVSTDSTSANATAAPIPPPPANTSDNASSDTTTLNQVVVTGVATFGGLRRKDTSYSITTADRQQIKEHNPVSVADLLKISPGVYSESSGGETGANIEVAGFPSDSGSPFVTFQINGAPMFPAWNYFSDALFRLDDTIDRVELVQGGPSVLYGNGQPGLIANFILRQGTATPSGDIGLTIGSEGMQRLDGFIGFPVGGADSQWFGSIGGFWRKSDGVRDPQFPADKGGQLTATLSHTMDNGSLLIYARVLKDKNQFVTDTPILNPSAGEFKEYPTFDPLTGTFSGNANRHMLLEVAPCYVNGCTPEGMQMDLANGEGANVHMLGANLDLYFDNGWSLSNKAFFMAGHANINAIFSTGRNPSSLADYIADATASYGLPSGLTPIAHYTNGDPVSLDQDVTVQNPEYIPKKLRTVSDELRLSKELFDGNTLTFGLYAAYYTVHHRGYDGLNQLLQTRSNPLPIRLRLTDGTHTYFLTNNQGLFWNANPQSWMALNERWHSRRTAFYIADQWHIGKWRFSGGIRADRVENEGWHQDTVSGGLDANPYTVYNNHAEYWAPTRTHYSSSRSHPSWTVGANYAISSNMNVYARVNEGVFLPRFNDIRGRDFVPIEKIHNMEVGFKYQSPWLFTSISAYRRLFYGIPYSINLASGRVNLVYGSETEGLNVQAKVKPFRGFTVMLGGNYMDGTYTHHQGCVPFIAQDGSQQCVSISGKRLSRQPQVQFRLTPAYAFPTSWGSMKFWLTYEFVGDRYGDKIEQQPLGHYHDIAIGARANVGQHWMLSLRGTNITNEIGITEGNARLFGFASGGGVILARSIRGREVNFQVKYKF